MRANLLKTLGVSTAALAIGISLIATPASAATWRGGGHGGGWHAGGGWRGGGGNWRGGGWRGGYYGGWNGGYWGPGYGDYGAALGLGLLGGALIASQAPYYGGAYQAYPQGSVADASGYCASRFKSYDPSSGTYLGYDGQRHPCP